MEKNEGHAALTAEIVLHIARLAHGEGHACGLTSAQWTALRYFARANRFSRTLSAFADYHVTTRGTASQTIKSLVTKGLLSRTPSQLDGRSSHIHITAKGRALCENDPFEELVSVIAELPETEQANMAATLEHVMGRITTDRRRRRFGTCPTCLYLQENADEGISEKTYFCHLTGESLPHSELEDICINYKLSLT